MSKIALSGNASGTGTFTLASPNSSTDRTLTLPDESGVIDRLNRAGNVLQVVRATDSTTRTTTSTTFVDANISVTITPTFSNSVVVLVWIFLAQTGNVGRTLHAQITDSSNNAISGAEEMNFAVTGDILQTSATVFAYASPATTSAVTYKGRFKVTGGGVNIQNAINTGQLYAIEVAA